MKKSSLLVELYRLSKEMDEAVYKTKISYIHRINELKQKCKHVWDDGTTAVTVVDNAGEQIGICSVCDEVRRMVDGKWV